MKQSQPERLESYQALVRHYHTSLDLLSPTGLRNLPLLVEEALFYPIALEWPLQAGEHWLDLGSGAGLPGLPLAITKPDLRFALVERRRRRASFLKLAAAQLQLGNVEVVAADIGHYQPDIAFPVISAQAVGSFSLIYALTRHLHAATVTIVARKGKDWQRELAALEEAVQRSADSSQEIILPRHGRLASVTITGGLPCPRLG